MKIVTWSTSGSKLPKAQYDAARKAWTTEVNSVEDLLGLGESCPITIMPKNDLLDGEIVVLVHDQQMQRF